MTIKELADVAGVSESTIRRTAKEIFPLSFKNGVKTEFDQQCSVEIMKEVKKKNMVAMQNEKLPMQNDEVDYEAIGKMIGMAVAAALTPVVERLDKMSNNQHLQIESPKQDHFTLMAYCSLRKIKVNLSEAKKMGMDVKKMTIAAGLEINEIPDERWGKVNSYPVEILEEYFSV